MSETMLTGKAMLSGVMGFPVGHSLSPKIHQHWIKQLGLDAAYVPMNVAPEHLKKALKALPLLGFKGCNLTVPLKEQAVAWMDSMDAQANAVGAVNTVVVQEGGLLHGMNTDVEGFKANLLSAVPAMETYQHKAVVIGAGGAARAVVKALIDLGFLHIAIANRTLERAEKLAGYFGEDIHVLPWEDRHAALAGAGLLVNTTTQGMQGQQALDISLDHLPQEAMVTDIIYTPRETPLLGAARARGNVIVEGIGMLIHQAVPGFKAWYGASPNVDKALYQWLSSS